MMLIQKQDHRQPNQGNQPFKYVIELWVSWQRSLMVRVEGETQEPTHTHWTN